MFGDELYCFVQFDVWNFLIGCGVGYVGVCDDWRDVVVGQGDVVVGKDGLDQELGVGDGNQGDELD